jgi:putative GTP pyrophosphokinase
LANIVHGITESLVRNSKIDYLSITRRAKTPESFAEKVVRKEYKNPRQDITDLAGVRIITYIESDANRVCELIEESFNVHYDKSLDKSNELAVDEIGYRSIHFVCDLGKDRVKLPEFSLYKDLVFEFQVRTVLQHAWAEIEHDRSYKFSGVLPSNLQRRLYLIAGMLEIADREFNDIAKELDSYAEKIDRDTVEGNLEHEINTTSLLSYLSSKFEQPYPSITIEIGPRDYTQIIDELTKYGVKTIAQLDTLLNSVFFDFHERHIRTTTYYGLLRQAMMFDNLRKYLSDAWQDHFQYMDEDGYEMLVERYGKEQVDEILSKYGVELENEAEFVQDDEDEYESDYEIENENR